MDLRGFWVALGARWRSGVAACVVGLVATGALFLTTPSVYTSSATLFVSTPPAFGFVNTFVAVTVTHERTQSYVHLVTDSRVLQSAGERLDMTPGELAGRLSAERVGSTLLIDVRGRAGTPERAQRIADVVAEEMVDVIAELEDSGDGASRLPFVVEVASRASLPTSRTEPDLLRGLGAGVLLSVLVGLAVAVLRRALDTTVSTSESLREASGLAPLVTVPRTARDGQVDEAFRVLRTNLQYAGIDGPRQVVLVTSATPEEGRTHVAVGLAAALADTGIPVLLVDADLRHPRIGTLLGLDDGVGLTSVLRHAVSLADAVHHHDSGVDVLAAGPPAPSPSDVLGSDAMRDLLTQARGRYDAIVVDAPALLPVADTAALLPRVDGALLVARHGAVTKDRVAEAVARIAAVDGQLLGTVLNDAPAEVTSGTRAADARRTR